jgi:hypothetical protein
MNEKISIEVDNAWKRRGHKDRKRGGPMKDKRTKRNRTKSDQKRNAINEQSK